VGDGRCVLVVPQTQLLPAPARIEPGIPAPPMARAQPIAPGWPAPYGMVAPNRSIYQDKRGWLAGAGAEAACRSVVDTLSEAVSTT